MGRLPGMGLILVNVVTGSPTAAGSMSSRHRQARAVLQLGQDPQVDLVEQDFFMIVGR